MKKTLIGLSLILALALSQHTAQAQTASKTVVIRLYEVSGAQNLIISYGNGKTETMKPDGFNGLKDQTKTTEMLQGVVDRLYNEGYHLVTSAGNASTTTLVFRRE